MRRWCDMAASVSIRDLVYAVTHDDDFDSDMLALDVERVLEIALKKKVGVLALAAGIASIDLGNGHSLEVVVSKT